MNDPQQELPAMPGDGSVCTLCVLDGPQAGARVALPAGRHFVGGGLDNDVVVCAVGLAASHFVIESGPRAVLRAGSASLRLADGTVLAGEGAREAGAVLRFQAGGTSFCLESHLVRPRRAAQRAATPVVALAACAVAALMLSAPGAESSSSLGRVLPDAAWPPTAAARAPNARTVAAALAERLDAAGVAGLLARPVADGSVEIGGSLAPGDAAAWAELLRWFDATYGNRVVLVDHAERSARRAPLAIAGVRLAGDASCVIDGSGRHLSVGSDAGEGWVIGAIEASHVTLRRGAETLSVRF